jgi:hypothetical protein
MPRTAPPRSAPHGAPHHARHVAVGLALMGLAALAGACDPTLGEAPFLCSATEQGPGACPGGYRCETGVCVREGAELGLVRAKQVEWINAGEMSWLPSSDGATLVVNDGFSAGEQGVFRVEVSSAGRVALPELVAEYVDVAPRASATVLLPDGRLAMALLRFPPPSKSTLELRVVAIDPDTGTSETLYEDDTQPYLGGAEPAYVSLVSHAPSGGVGLALAWTHPADGGLVEVVQLTQNGSVWGAVRATQVLPESVLPLSGDSLLLPTGDGRLLVRVGFESFAYAEVTYPDGAPTIGEFVDAAGVPMFAWGDRVLDVVAGDDLDDGGYEVLYELRALDGSVLESVPAGAFQADYEPYVASARGDRALLVGAADGAFAPLEVRSIAADGSFDVLAEIERGSENELYSSRAFVHDGVAYVAWTEFAGALMELWIATIPVGS